MAGVTYTPERLVTRKIRYSGLCFCFGALDVDCLTKCNVNLFDRRLDGLWFLCVFFSRLSWRSESQRWYLCFGWGDVMARGVFPSLMFLPGLSHLVTKDRVHLEREWVGPQRHRAALTSPRWLFDYLYTGRTKAPASCKVAFFVCFLESFSLVHCSH